MNSRIATLCFALAAGVAHAQPAPPATEADLCSDTKNNPDLAIKHCTAAIETRKANNEMLAQWYVLRGVHWSYKGDYDRAIADHTTALKLDANTRHAYYYRGTAWSNKGEFERAIADFDAAIKARTDDPVHFSHVGGNQPQGVGGLVVGTQCVFLRAHDCKPLKNQLQLQVL